MSMTGESGQHPTLSALSRTLSGTVSGRLSSPVSGLPPATVRSTAEDAAWADAQAAAEELTRDLAEAGFSGACVGLRAVRNVAGRPVVQVGTVEPEVARRLGDLLRIACTRTLYIVRTDAADGPAMGDVS
jgi:hypothetical protein